MSSGERTLASSTGKISPSDLRRSSTSDSDDVEEELTGVLEEYQARALSGKIQAISRVMANDHMNTGYSVL
jgi:hypothetical protein